MLCIYLIKKHFKLHCGQYLFYFRNENSFQLLITTSQLKYTLQGDVFIINENACIIEALKMSETRLTVSTDT